MIAIVSPAKTQDFQSPLQTSAFTQLRFQKESSELIGELRKLKKVDIQVLMSVSEKIAELNFGRYKNYRSTFSPSNARQALLAFKGDVYTDIEVDDYSKEDFQFAQDHLRILSGLYGLIRPLDLMQPYRLEMKIKLVNKKGKDLYAFWGTKITELLREDLADQGDDILVNLASMEYFKVIQSDLLGARIITPVFMEQKKEGPKIVALFAKRARGMMSNYIVRNRLADPEDLKKFNQAGYRFDSKLSEGDKWVFLRG